MDSGNQNLRKQPFFSFLKDVASSLDQNEATIGIFLDLSKALTSLIITFYFQNYLPMESVVLLQIGYVRTLNNDLRE